MKARFVTTSGSFRSIQRLPWGPNSDRSTAITNPCVSTNAMLVACCCVGAARVESLGAPRQRSAGVELNHPVAAHRHKRFPQVESNATSMPGEGQGGREARGTAQRRIVAVRQKTAVFSVVSRRILWFMTSSAINDVLASHAASLRFHGESAARFARDSRAFYINFPLPTTSS